MRPGTPATAPLFRLGGVTQPVPARDGVQRRRVAPSCMVRGQTLALLEFLGPEFPHSTHWMIRLGVGFDPTNPWLRRQRIFGDGDPEGRRRQEHARPWRECRARRRWR